MDHSDNHPETYGKACVDGYDEMVAKLTTSHGKVIEFLNTTPLVVVPAHVKDLGDQMLLCASLGGTELLPIAVLTESSVLQTQVEKVFLREPYTFKTWKHIPGLSDYADGGIWKV